MHGARHETGVPGARKEVQPSKGGITSVSEDRGQKVSRSPFHQLRLVETCPKEAAGLNGHWLERELQVEPAGDADLTPIPWTHGAGQFLAAVHAPAQL